MDLIRKCLGGINEGMFENDTEVAFRWAADNFRINDKDIEVQVLKNQFGSKMGYDLIIKDGKYISNLKKDS